MGKPSSAVPWEKESRKETQKEDGQLSRPQSIASAGAHSLHDEPPPYDDSVAREQPPTAGQSSAAAPISRDPAASEAPSPSPSQQRPPLHPTASAPFQFPTAVPLPSYAQAEPIHRPLAVPQIEPSAAAPFLAAYPPALLAFGIPAETWYGFVDVLSDFLSAEISKQALYHATDIALSIGENSRKFFTGDAVSRAQGIGRQVQKGNIGGTLSGIIRLNHAFVGHVLGTVFSLPGHLAKKPQTPRGRAEAYIITANRDWFHQRGLHAMLLDTTQLSGLANVSVQKFIESLHANAKASPAEQLAALQPWIGSLQIKPTPQSVAAESGPSNVPARTPDASVLSLSPKTLWLVLTKGEGKPCED